MDVLKVEDLHVSFQTKKGRKLAVDGVSFSVRAGEIFGLDPGVIYSKQSYRNALEKEIEECRQALNSARLEDDLKKIWKKGLSWKMVKTGLEGLGEYSRQSVFLGLCDTVKKQIAERPLAEAPVRGSVGKDYNAALWAVKNGLV